jgi:hypothetical protein
MCIKTVQLSSFKNTRCTDIQQFTFLAFSSFLFLPKQQTMKQHHAVALHRLFKNKIYSIINIGGLMIGAAVAVFIGFWIAEEVSTKTVTKNNHLITNSLHALHQNIKQPHIVPITLSEELRISFGNNFELLVLTSKNDNELLTTIDKKICCREISSLTDKNY